MIYQVIHSFSKGSALVEAVIIFPLIIAVVFSMLVFGIKLEEKSISASKENINVSSDILDSFFGPEEILRLSHGENE